MLKQRKGGSELVGKCSEVKDRKIERHIRTLTDVAKITICGNAAGLTRREIMRTFTHMELPCKNIFDVNVFLPKLDHLAHLRREVP